MPNVTETVTTRENSNKTEEGLINRDRTSQQTAGILVYFIFGILNVLLAFRLVFKLLGANASSGFVAFVYNLSAIFIAPFAGIFNTSITDGSTTAAVFEPATLIAFVVYAFLAWGIVSLIRLFSNRQHTN